MNTQLLRHRPHRGLRRSAGQALGAAVALAALGAGPLAGVSAAHQTAPAVRADSKTAPNAAKTYGIDAVAATNKARVGHGLPALKASSCLHDYAVAQAERMAGSSTMYHQDLSRVLRACHFTSAGENVAYGFATGTVVVTQGWMRSSGHRANILDTDFTSIGIGARKDSSGTWYVSQVFGG